MMKTYLVSFSSSDIPALKGGLIKLFLFKRSAEENLERNGGGR
jgi:hypothetical protein